MKLHTSTGARHTPTFLQLVIRLIKVKLINDNFLKHYNLCCRREIILLERLTTINGRTLIYDSMVLFFLSDVLRVHGNSALTSV